jgi:hypothetical protein
MADPTALSPDALRARYLAAPTFAEYLPTVDANQKLWHDAARLARVSDADVARAAALPGRWHLLVLSEDWCGDAVNTVPFLARLAEGAPAQLDLRVLGRDANEDLMDAHLTGTSRSIPIAIVYDDAFRGARVVGPAPCGAPGMGPGRGPGPREGGAVPPVRTWYARDRGAPPLTRCSACSKPRPPAIRRSSPAAPGACRNPRPARA